MDRVFEQSVVVVPLVLCAPRLLDPSLDLTLGQRCSCSPSQRVFDGLNLPAHNWSAIWFAATVVRLVEFERSVSEAGTELVGGSRSRSRTRVLSLTPCVHSA